MLLVTGGAGFIGANVIAALNAQGRDDIIVIDDLMDGRKCLNLVGKKFADYRDWHELTHTNVATLDTPHIHGIIHLGAISDTMFTNGKILMEQNYGFSKRMLKLAEHHGCPMVYASSASVYGDGKIGFQEKPENEMPKSPYAFSKWIFDQYVRRHTANGHITVPVAGMRYFNVYGPGEQYKGAMRSFANKCFTAITRGEKIELFNGSQDIIRDFIYVSDAAAVTLFFLQNNMSGIFNVGTGTPTSFLDVAELCVKAAEADTEIHMIPFPEHMADGYQRHTQADITKLRVAGWTSPFTSLEAGIKDYWQRFKERN
jgi:ADP-L-glycero-D-manno-heptose 6-epimerase